MTRINVYTDYNATYDEYPESGNALAGWFDDQKCLEIVAEDTFWDGNNHISVNGGRGEHEELILTAGSRWVLHHWSQWQGSAEMYVFVDTDRARAWLLLNSADDIIRARIGEVEEESGPNPGGRPEIGPVINVRMPVETLAALDKTAADRGMTRAALIRDLVKAGLA